MIIYPLARRPIIIASLLNSGYPFTLYSFALAPKLGQGRTLNHVFQNFVHFLHFPFGAPYFQTSLKFVDLKLP